MRWLVEVSSLAKTEEQKLCVEAESWQRALQAARAQRGEEGSISNFAIDLLAEGYRAVDPVGKMRFVVKRAPDGMPVTTIAIDSLTGVANPPSSANPTIPFPLSPASSEPVSTAAGAKPASDAPPKKSSLPPRPTSGGSSVPPTGDTKTATPKPKTMVFASNLDASDADTNDTRSVADRPPTPAIGSDIPGLPHVTLLSSREQEPTESSPLTYREYAFLAPEGTNEEVAIEILRAQLQLVEAHIGGAKIGKLVNLAVFDVSFTGKPPKPPLATLTWKDWKGQPVVSFPRRSNTSILPRPPSQPSPSLLASVTEGSPVAVIPRAPAVPKLGGSTPPPANPDGNVALVSQAPAAVVVPSAPPPPVQIAASAPPPPAQAPPAQAVSAPPPAAPAAEAVVQAASAPPLPARASNAPPAAEAVVQAISAPPLPARASSAPPPPVQAVSAPPVQAASAPPPPVQTASVPPAPLTAPIDPFASPTNGTPSTAPVAFPAGSSPMPMARTRSGRFVPGRISGDELITSFFESMHDLHFLRDALEGGEFCLTLATQALPSRAAFVHFFDIEARQWIVACTYGNDTSSLLATHASEADVPLREAARHGKAVVLNDTSSETTSRYAHLGGARSVIVAPVKQAGRTLAAIELVDPLDGKPFEDVEGNAITYVAEQYAEYLGSRGIVLDVERIRRAAATSA